MCTQALYAVNQTIVNKYCQIFFFIKSKFDRKSDPVIWVDYILPKYREYNVLGLFKVFPDELSPFNIKGQSVCVLST